MTLNPDCSEIVIRIDTSKLVSKRARDMILEHFKDTKANYEDETDGADWFSYLLKYMKLKENKDVGEIIIYCSRLDGEDDFILDLHDVEFLYTKKELIVAYSQGKVLSTKIKGVKRWKNASV